MFGHAYPRALLELFVNPHLRDCISNLRPMSTSRLTILFSVTLPLLAAADPFVGTWKLNPSRSNFAPGAPRFILGAIQIESAGNGLKSTASGADGKGIVSDFTFSCQLDGTPCKVTPATMPLRSASAVDTITLKRIDPTFMMATGTRNGKLVYSDRRVVSADGKTMTVIRDGTTPEGKKYESTIVLDRLP